MAPVSETRVNVLFYGSYMNRDVLAEVDLDPGDLRVVRLNGYDIRISPLANLVPSDRHMVYGLLGRATHSELDRLYRHAEQVLGGKYLPFPVLAELREDSLVTALCYIAPSMEAHAADPAYVDRILAPAREFGFPAWYVERIQSYR
jgi:hypothetical protein